VDALKTDLLAAKDAADLAIHFLMDVMHFIKNRNRNYFDSYDKIL
jgi:energy-converting hydrogenase A subunit M